MPADEKLRFICDWPLRLIIAFLIIFSPLIYGGVTSLPLAVIELSAYFLLAIFILRLLLSRRISLFKSEVSWLLIFAAWVLFQCLPLPIGVVKLFSPAAGNLYRLYSDTALSLRSISINLDGTVELLLQLLAFLAIYFVGLHCFSTGRLRARFVELLILTGSGLALYGILTKQIVASPGFATFTNRNHCAAFLELIIPLSLAYALTPLALWKRISCLFLSALMLLAIFMSFSRSGIIASLLGLGFFAWLVTKKSSGLKGIFFIVIVSAFILAAFVFMDLSAITERISTLGNPASAIGGRIAIFVDSLRAFADFPITGSGFGTFVDIFHVYQTFGIEWWTAPFFAFAHSEPLQLLVETGLVGFLLVSAFLFRYAYRVGKAWRLRASSEASILAVGCFCGLGSFLIHSFSDFVLHVPANMVICAVVLALGYRFVFSHEADEITTLNPLHPEIKPALSLKILLAGLIFSGFMSLSFLVISRTSAELRFQDIPTEKMAETDTDALISYKRKIKELNRCLKDNPLNSIYVSAKADMLAEVAARPDLEGNFFVFGNYASRDDILMESRRLYGKAIDLSVTTGEYHLRLGWLYTVMREESLAKEQFRKALRLNPQNPKIRKVAEGYLSGSLSADGIILK